MNIVIVIARSGSKRIKNKNIKKFNKKPIIIRTINNLKKMNLFNKIVVSTDSKKIANIAYSAGALIPFFRPKSLSNDNASTRDVIVHAIKKLIKKYQFSDVYCVYPTSVFLKKTHIAKAKKLLKKDTSYVFSASRVNPSFLRSFFLNKNKQLQMYKKKNYNLRTQDLNYLYYDIGQFYLANVDTWLTKKFIFNSKSKFVEIDKNSAYDIDTLSDWKFAESLYLRKNEK